MTDLSIVDSAFDTVGSAGEAALDAVVGGAAMALDTATRPRRTAGRARRRGSQVNEAIAEATEEVVEGVAALPERVLLAYVRLLRRQGRRDDLVGSVSRTVLGAVHGQARGAARFFGRLERESDVDAQGRRRTGATTRRRVTAGRRTSTPRGTTTRRRTTTAARTTTRRRSA
jgi:hypothetical protein